MNPVYIARQKFLKKYWDKINNFYLQTIINDQKDRKFSDAISEIVNDVRKTIGDYVLKAEVKVTDKEGALKSKIKLEDDLGESFMIYDEEDEQCWIETWLNADDNITISISEPGIMEEMTAAITLDNESAQLLIGYLARKLRGGGELPNKYNTN